jgi:hypothetical protein
MSIILFIKSLFKEPTFKPGERVNHVRRGAIQRTDGYVVAYADGGVLVEWPRGGANVIPATELAVIG